MSLKPKLYRRVNQRFFYQIVLQGFLMGLGLGCAHQRGALWSVNQPNAGKEGAQASTVRSHQRWPRKENVQAASVLKTQEELDWEDVPSVQNALMVQNGKLIVEGVALKNTEFDIPITVNSRVGYWVDYFCNRGRSYFEKYLERSEYFIPYIVPLLKQHGLPQDLVYLAMIESGFNNLARSHAKAVGPWQFVAGTGRRYGLKVNWWIDERRDTAKATLAAIGYLKDLYGMFDSWELAAAAYDAGEGKIGRAIRRYRTRDFWVLSKQRFLAAETRDYVPKIIAAAMIAKNRTQFGFPERFVKAGEGEVLATSGELVKLEKTERPVADSEYRSEKAADLKELKLAGLEFPSENDPNALSQEANSRLGLYSEVKPVLTPSVSRSGEVTGEELLDFEVQSPADLLQISRAAGLTYQTVKALNPEILRWCTPPNVMSYRIKLPAFVRDRFLATYNHEAFPKKIQFMTYQVNRGDTLARIARIFRIRVDPIQDLNRVHPRLSLKKGSKVLLPMPNDRYRTFASLEVYDPPEPSRYRWSRRNSRLSRHRHGSGRIRSDARPLLNKKKVVDVVFARPEIRGHFGRKS